MAATPCPRERGALMLEAGISITLFMVLAAFLITWFPMYIVQHATAHAILEAGESLSLDAFAAERYDAAETQAAAEAVMTITDFARYTTWRDPNEVYTTLDRWYYDNTRSATLNEEFEKRVRNRFKQRFCAYLLEDGSNRTGDIDTLLRRMGVTNGLNGIDFTDTTIFHLNGTDEYTLIVCVRYQFNDQFHLLSTPARVEQQAQFRLWTRRTTTN